MLQNLIIKNMALISSLEIEFDKGLNVLSGETGSGKSIIVDSLAFVLGERADKTMIKFGQEIAMVEATFSLDLNSKAREEIFKLLGTDDDIIVISRTLNLSGKNDCRVNGRPTANSTLKLITGSLVDIFGQSEHLFLLKVDKHIDVIDGYIKNNDLASLSDLTRSFKEINNSLSKFGLNIVERERMLDLLKYQIDEITIADIKDDEEDELLQLRNKVLNAEKINLALSGSSNLLINGELSAVDSIASALSQMTAISTFSPDIEDLRIRLSSAYYELRDIAEIINDKQSETEFDQKEIDLTEQRLEVIKSIKKKYGKTLMAVKDYLKKIEMDYDELVNATEIIAKLEAKKEKALKLWYTKAIEVSNCRRTAALEFEIKIQKELVDLGMKGATFVVDFGKQPDFSIDLAPSAKGLDEVEFLLSANKGEPLKPLAKVISGGEMSRFMLAIKNITAEIEQIPTMVFDEIDTGISGNMAQMVALKLKNVSKNYQSIVVTHLPQITSIADTNFVIYKIESNDRTETNINKLDENGKINEVARLMGGSNIGEFGLLHAKEMIQWAKNSKSE